MVFVYLCDEINELIQICEANFLPTLVVFGESGRPGEEDLAPGPGVRERRVGHILPLLQVKQEREGIGQPRHSSKTKSCISLYCRTWQAS